jgi:hypothetical protein
MWKLLQLLFCVVVVGDIGAREQRQSFILFILYDMNISNATKHQTRKRRPSSLSVGDTTATIPKTTGSTDPPSQKTRINTYGAMAAVVKCLRRHTRFILLLCQVVLFVCLFVVSIVGRIRGKFLDGKTAATSAGTFTLGIGLDAKRAFHHTCFVINNAALDQL